MRIAGAWLQAASLRAVFDAFAAAGHRALLVGGAVRDAVRGEAVGDLDLASDATPEQMIALSEAAGLRPVPTGIDHGTVTIVAEGVPHEVTTFRRDIETFGRHARVAFTDDIAEDAARRDFTMNALYADATGAVLDPLGGLEDALQGRVRFIGEADRRIVEDYLRILRFFRFHAQFGQGGDLDADGLAAVARHIDGLDNLARERIGAEMRKLLAATDPAPAVAAMRQSGVLARVLPGADDTGLAPLVHLEAQAAVPPEPIRRLAALGGEDAAARLRLSKAETRRLALLREAVGGTGQAAELGYRHGVATGLDILLLRAALLQAPLPAQAQDSLEHGAKSVFPVHAADLMPALQGKALGIRLAELEERWIASGFALGRAELLGE